MPNPVIGFGPWDVVVELDIKRLRAPLFGFVYFAAFVALCHILRVCTCEPILNTHFKIPQWVSSTGSSLPTRRTLPLSLNSLPGTPTP